MQTVTRAVGTNSSGAVVEGCLGRFELTGELVREVIDVPARALVPGTTLALGFRGVVGNGEAAVTVGTGVSVVRTTARRSR
jgi:hypothetical protein